MDVDLTPDLQQYVAEKVAGGTFSASSAVVVASIRLLREQEAISEFRIDELRKDLALGIEQADKGDLLDGEAFMVRLMTRGGS